MTPTPFPARPVRPPGPFPNPTDCAIVVAGLPARPDDHPHPEAEARAFADWLREPGGGGLDPSRVWLLLPGPSRPPSRGAVLGAFGWLDQLALDGTSRDGLHVGKRLYLYFAGRHPATRPAAEDRASPDRTPPPAEEVVGVAYAEWFYRAGYFDEVLLFRDNAAPPGSGHDRVKVVHRCGRGLTRRGPGRPPRGLFLLTLLAGLRSRDPLGRVGAAGLPAFLERNLRDLTALAAV